MSDDAAVPVELPMFPLGSVLLPGMLLPLRVFEPRYRVLVDTVLLSDEQTFGSVLIERGSEVGGGDVRADVGCEARIVQFDRHPDGQLDVVAVGTRRLAVGEWLDDDPYPRAMVTHLDDRADPDSEEGVAERVERLRSSVAELGERAVELGLTPSFDLDGLAEDPVLRTFQLATVSPIGALDRLKVLRTETLAERVALLGELVEEQRILLDARRDDRP